MRKISIVHALAIVVSVVAMTATSSGARGTGKKLFTTLSGAEEADTEGNVGVGDPDGTGTASLRLNQGRGEVCWKITWSNIEAPTAAHIHEAPAGVPGPVVVPLDPIAAGCTDANKALIKDIRKNPTDYYVNVHNASFPNGAIRGQLGD